ncbi:MAG: hypothetical protein OEW18_11095, partial [Candidatus Aminicenantes bacterium]|nr:hypothetical protein [Candidatus Aminicenantes bacterium]
MISINMGERKPFCLLALLIFLTGISARHSAVTQELPPQTSQPSLLRLLGLEASPESIDYVQNKTQFQLHNLLTEQRHTKTWNLSERLQKDVADGLKMLFSVDEDISARVEELASDDQALEPLVAALEQAILDKKHIYIYGCGATGRLAKQMESSFWRPFWKRIKSDSRIWPELQSRLSSTIEDDLCGEMTGADR